MTAQSLRCGQNGLSSRKLQDERVTGGEGGGREREFYVPAWKNNLTVTSDCRPLLFFFPCYLVALAICIAFFFAASFSVFFFFLLRAFI